MCFYAALHYIEAYAAWRGHNIYELYPDPMLSQHKRRSRYVDDISVDNDLYELPVVYENLYQASMRARYLKGIKTNSARHFKIGVDFYIRELEKVKAELKIDLFKDLEDS
jgi:hypothetical protein